MSQFDWGLINPLVDDGTQLADDLNQWRDAVYSLHRGAARPAYAVPGLMWINDSAGPTNWLVNMYLGAAGDRLLFTFNSTTGTGGPTGNFLEARAASNPVVMWNATGNPASQQVWQAYETTTGALRFGAYDGPVETNYIEFKRDGTLGGPATGGLEYTTTLVTAASIIQTPVLTKKCIDFSFNVVPTTTPATLFLKTSSGGAISSANYYQQTTYSQSTSVFGSGAGPLSGWSFGSNVGNLAHQGVSGRIHFPDISTGKGVASIYTTDGGNILILHMALAGPAGDGLALAFSPGGNIQAGATVRVVGY